MDYKVTWETLVSADNPTHAARLALEIQRDKESSAVVFRIETGEGLAVDVDLWEGS